MIFAKALTEYRSIECVAHKIHLLVTDAIDDSPIKEIVDKMKKIITFFKQSTTAKAELDAFRVEGDLKVYSLLQSVPTRWDSVYLMMERFMELKDDLAKVILKHKDCESMCTALQLEVVNEAMDMLFQFHDFTKEMSSEEMPTSCVPVPLTCTIKKYLIDYVANTTEAEKLRVLLLKGLVTRLEPLEKNDDFAFATLLDPRVKNTQFISSSAATMARVRLTNKIVELREKERKEKRERAAVVVVPDSDAEPDSEEDTTSAQEPEPKRKRQSVRSLMTSSIPYGQDNDRVTPVMMVNAYIKETMPKGGNPLVYWEEHKETWPELYKLAMEYLTSPGSSVASERAASVLGNLVGPRRASLGDDYISQRLFLKSLSLAILHEVKHLANVRPPPEDSLDFNEATARKANKRKLSK